MSRRAEAAADTRDRIVDAVLERFGSLPYDRIRLEDVAADAEVSLPTVLRHFGSKAGLVTAMATRELRRIAAVDSTGDENCVMSTSAAAGTSSNCRLAACIASRQRATRINGSGSSVGSSATSADTRLVHGSSSLPVRIDTGTIARSGRSGRASWRSR